MAQKWSAKWPALGLALSFSAGMMFVGSAQAQVASDNGRRSYIVVDANNFNVLYEDSAQERRYPASLTKIMTLYLLFEAMDRGELNWDSQITFSRNAANAPPTELGVRAGGSISVETAVNAIILRSANDVAVAVGERLAGSEAAFARMMTAKAQELGMAGTQFRNASGLPNPQQYTTAEDMARLAIAIRRDFPQNFYLFSRTEYQWGNETIVGHNRLLGAVDGVDGLKTGYTRASGYNLAATAGRGNERLAVVVMGGATIGERNQDVTNLIETGFSAMGVSQYVWQEARRDQGLSDSSADEADFESLGSEVPVGRASSNPIILAALTREERPLVMPAAQTRWAAPNNMATNVTVMADNNTTTTNVAVTPIVARPVAPAPAPAPNAETAPTSVATPIVPVQMAEVTAPVIAPAVAAADAPNDAPQMVMAENITPNSSAESAPIIMAETAQSTQPATVDQTAGDQISNAPQNSAIRQFAQNETVSEAAQTSPAPASPAPINEQVDALVSAPVVAPVQMAENAQPAPAPIVTPTIAPVIAPVAVADNVPQLPLVAEPDVKPTLVAVLADNPPPQFTVPAVPSAPIEQVQTAEASSKDVAEIAVTTAVQPTDMPADPAPISTPASAPENAPTALRPVQYADNNGGTSVAGTEAARAAIEEMRAGARERELARLAAIETDEAHQRQAAQLRQRQLAEAHAQADAERTRRLAQAQAAQERADRQQAANEEARRQQQLAAQRGNTSIQIGAFSSRNEAEHAIAQAGRFLPSFARSEVSQVRTNGGTLFRARFNGLAIAAARAACTRVTGGGGQCQIIGQ